MRVCMFFVSKAVRWRLMGGGRSAPSKNIGNLYVWGQVWPPSHTKALCRTFTFHFLHNQYVFSCKHLSLEGDGAKIPQKNKNEEHSLGAMYVTHCKVIVPYSLVPFCETQRFDRSCFSVVWEIFRWVSKEEWNCSANRMNSKRFGASMGTIP